MQIPQNDLRVNAPGSTAPGDGEGYAPLPQRQFRRFILIFHVVFIGGLLFSLVMRWRRPGMEWSWRDIILVVLVAIQAAIYLRFFAIGSGSPFSGRKSSLYFTTAFAIWLTEWRLESAFEWAIGALLGQLFGVLPPKASLPASAGVFLIYFWLKFGWSRLLSLNRWEVISGFAAIVAWTALGLFIHRLSVTSSDRARLIDQLEAARRQLELARQRELELATLRERERLARDLHDSLGHSLVTLTVQMEAAQRLFQTDPARAGALLEEMKQLTRSSMEQLRRSLAGLRAPGLGDRRLPAALAQLCDEVKQRGQIDITCQIAPAAEHLPPALAEAVWRLAQEGLANAERHSRATRAHLALETAGSKASPAAGERAAQSLVTVRLTDNGIGLPEDAEDRPGHYGLRGLRERFEGLGGRFTAACSRPGTALEGVIPWVV
jgi:signal transduction histidine kinase